MKACRKIGRIRRVYHYRGADYINNHHAHNHLGLKLWNPDTGETIYARKDDISPKKRYTIAP